jgi:NTE family protein
MNISQDGSHSVGLALSGGGFRGLAHIGVVKVLSERGVAPGCIAGTSVGSLIGALLASGKTWRELADIATTVFWPELLDGRSLERVCAKLLPKTFDGLRIPFAAVAVDVKTKRPVVMKDGDLASAINASCALPIRRPVERDGRRLTDGGLACVLPATVCRELGARCVISSDVWGVSWGLRAVGIEPDGVLVGRAYPAHYREALQATDVLIAPNVPLSGAVPGARGVERMVAEGERAACASLAGALEKFGAGRA